MRKTPSIKVVQLNLDFKKSSLNLFKFSISQVLSVLILARLLLRFVTAFSNVVKRIKTTKRAKHPESITNQFTSD